MLRSAKIIATLGPSSNTEAVVASLIEAGMDVARLNFSHGTHADHARQIALVRELSRRYNKPISILQDLQGPKIRVGSLPQPVTLKTGTQVRLSTRQTPDQAAEAICDPGRFSRALAFRLAGEPHPARRRQAGAEGDLCPGRFGRRRGDPGRSSSSHKGINLPGSVLPIPGFTEKDREDLAFGLSQGVDAVAISFVRTPQDVDTVRQAIAELAPEQADTLLIAKLERPEAFDNLEEILERSDGVMVARGDLGVEMSPASVPIAQKQIIAAATAYSKLVITATQMLESMINNPRPTRAEASDVANAIFDGSDALMLSGETASGSYPVESVATMHAIIEQAEEHAAEWGHCQPPLDVVTQDDAISITRAARELAHDRNVAAVAVFTRTGHTGLLMSKTRPQVPILAFTPVERTYSRLGLFWGVIPFLVPFAASTEEMIAHVDHALLTSTPIQEGEQVVLITGFPVATFRRPNLALLHTVGEKD